MSSLDPAGFWAAAAAPTGGGRRTSNVSCTPVRRGSARSAQRLGGLVIDAGGVGAIRQDNKLAARALAAQLRVLRLSIRRPQSARGQFWQLLRKSHQLCATAPLVSIARPPEPYVPRAEPRRTDVQLTKSSGRPPPAGAAAAAHKAYKSRRSISTRENSTSRGLQNRISEGLYFVFRSKI